jgi:hypothetical protein
MAEESMTDTERKRLLNWRPLSAYDLSQLRYADRVAYEGERRAAMRVQGVTEAELRLSPQGLLRHCMRKLGTTP